MTFQSLAASWDQLREEIRLAEKAGDAGYVKHLRDEERVIRQKITANVPKMASDIVYLIALFMESRQDTRKKKRLHYPAVRQGALEALRAWEFFNPSNR